MSKQILRSTRIDAGGGGGDAATGIASHEGDYHSKRKDSRRITVDCSSLNSRNPAIMLLVFLGLSLWTSPTSMTAEAFATLATASQWNRPKGIVVLNSNGRVDGKFYSCRRERTRKHRLRRKTSLPMTFSRGVSDDRQYVLPLAGATAATSDGGNVFEEKEKLVAVAPKSRPPPHTTKAKKKTGDRVRVTTVAEMRQRLSEGRSLFELDARGDSQEILEARSDEHPVLEIIRKRAEAGKKPGSHGDGAKVGLAIEGGGMRGCVSAGMVAAVSTLGLMDTFDVVYGSSAGSLVGAYAIAGQEGMPRLGCSVYYDTLTGGGRHFIDTRQFFRAMGLGLLGTVATRWRGFRELVRQKWGSPVLNLNYLLRDVVENQRPLDWEGFWVKQANQPLHVIASGVASKKPVVLTSSGGHFRTLRELTECMRASMSLPGITGPMVTLPNIEERLVDSQLYAPIPFRTALDDGCTHVLVLRSRPDGGNLLGKPKLAERLISRRFFKRKNKDPDSYAYVKSGGHKKLYAESVLTLNEAARVKSGDSGPHIMPMCLPASEPEVGRLEQRRESILEGVRKGYEHAHVLLRRTVPDHATARLDGRQAALQTFPESILDEETDPLVREVLDRSRGKVQGEGGQRPGGQTTPEP